MNPFHNLVHIERWLLLPRWFEQQQTEAGVKRVKDWAAAKSSRLEDSDIFISGNADEVFNNFKATCVLTCTASGSQPIFNAQLSALSAVQRYDDRGALDADGRPRLGISTRLECERPASLLSHALHLYLGPGGQWEAERGAPFQRQRRQVRMVFIRINIITSIHKCK